MKCRDFREIADTYLSDELLVETNHEVLSHLEQCRECRGELNMRREVRGKLRSAIINADESQFDPIFANKLRSNLKEQSKVKSFAAFRNLGFAFASLMIILVSSLFLVNYQRSNNELALWKQFSNEAIVAHKECAIAHAEDWETATNIETPEKVKFRSEILTPLKANYNESVEVLDMHECEFYGKKYRHYVLKSGNHTISFLQNETDSNSETKTSFDAGKIISEPQGDYQIASFSGKGNPVFVISDMTEAENLNIARVIRNSPSI